MQLRSRTVDKPNITGLAAMYVQSDTNSVGFGNDGFKPNLDALHIDLEGGADRFYDTAFHACELSEAEATAAGNEARDAYNNLTTVEQRAALIMMDVSTFTEHLGAEAPQTQMARIAYAAATLDGAINGTYIPPLEPTYIAIPAGKSKEAELLREADTIAAAAVSDTLALAAQKAFKRNTGRDFTPVDSSRARPLPPPATLAEIFDGKHDGCIIHTNGTLTAGYDCIMGIAKAKTAPDIFSERQMLGPEWDEPKQVEVGALERMGAFTKIAANDPIIRGWKVVETMWTGRVKRNADRSIKQHKGRCVLRGDLHKGHYAVDSNQSFGPVVRNTSNSAIDCVSVLYQWHMCSFDLPSAYLQGKQRPSEQVVARPPPGFREYDEQGVEVLWLMHSPLYGQTDAGAIWNRTFNDWTVEGHDVKTNGTSYTHAADLVTADAHLANNPYHVLSEDTQEMWSHLDHQRCLHRSTALPAHASDVPAAAPPVEPDKDVKGPGMERCPHDPCVYVKTIGADGQDRCVMPIYVDDGRVYYSDTEAAKSAGAEIRDKLKARFGAKFSELDPIEDYFLGANRTSSKARDTVVLQCTSYIDSMVERYCNGDVSPCKEYPGSWGDNPADDDLTKAYEEAILTRTPADKALFTEFNSVVGSLRHAVKYRPEISAPMDLLGCCLTFPTTALLRCAYRVLVYLGRTRKLGIRYSKHGPRANELYARADANWRTTRSTSGFCIFLGGAVIAHYCGRQGCIAMSTTAAELYALVRRAPLS